MPPPRRPATGEFDRIARFLRHFDRPRGGVVPVGPGDDCAVVRPRPGTDLCVTTDSVVEGVHFTREAFSYADIGHKALAVNLSDLAAMGAAPAWFVCALQVPPFVTDAQLDGLARGMAKLAKRSGMGLVGGNFSSGTELAVTLTVTGEVKEGRALRRDGAGAGDLLFVSGTLGDARWGLEQLGVNPRARAPGVSRQKRPQPRLALGRLAARFASAAIDLSDGLGQDLGHLCDASRVGARVSLLQLPTSPALRRAKGAHARRYAAAGGEDYELLVSVPKRRAAAFVRACREAGERVTHIGELTSERALRFEAETGRHAERPGGFDHFRNRSAN